MLGDNWKILKKPFEKYILQYKCLLLNCLSKQYPYSSTSNLSKAFCSIVWRGMKKRVHLPDTASQRLCSRLAGTGLTRMLISLPLVDIFFNQHSICLFLLLLKLLIAFDGYLDENFNQHSVHLAG